MKTGMMVMLAVLIGATAMGTTGCSRPQAKGKLQIMYSGNIRGNISPCG